MSPEERSDRGWRVVAVDVALVGGLVAWALGAWLIRGGPGAETHSPKHPGQAVSVSDSFGAFVMTASDPLGAFTPVGAHGPLDCRSYLEPWLRSLQAVQHAASQRVDRAAYDALLSTEQAVYSRSNVGALDTRCAVLVGTPAATASDAYAAA